jgi:hypothetical protein
MRLLLAQLHLILDDQGLTSRFVPTACIAWAFTYTQSRDILLLGFAKLRPTGREHL